MDLTIDSLKGIDARLLAAMLTGLLAFVAWLMHSFIQSPLDRARDSFMIVFSKRVEVTGLIRNHLVMIELFSREHAEMRKIKIGLQTILLESGASAYLDQRFVGDLLKVAVSSDHDRRMVQTLIRKSNADIERWSSRIVADNRFYLKYQRTDPVKRFVVISFLSIRSILVVFMSLCLLYWFMLQIIPLPLTIQFLIFGVVIILLWQSQRLFHWFRFRWFHERKSHQTTEKLDM